MNILNVARAFLLASTLFASTAAVHCAEPGSESVTPQGFQIKTTRTASPSALIICQNDGEFGCNGAPETMIREFTYLFDSIFSTERYAATVKLETVYIDGVRDKCSIWIGGIKVNSPTCTIAGLFTGTIYDNMTPAGKAEFDSVLAVAECVYKECRGYAKNPKCVVVTTVSSPKADTDSAAAEAQFYRTYAGQIESLRVGTTFDVRYPNGQITSYLISHKSESPLGTFLTITGPVVDTDPPSQPCKTQN